MAVTVSKHSGFCFGVRRAMGMVEESTGNYSRVYTLGPIIHNSCVVSSLEKKGVFSVSSLDEVAEKEGSAVIIRSHGVGPHVYEEASQKGITLVDATCPFVKRIHSLVCENSAKGVFIVIVGDKNHPEVEGIKAWASGKAQVVYNAEEALEFVRSNPQYSEPVMLVAQTTIAVKRFKDVADVFTKAYPNVNVVETICSETSLRQTSAVELAKKSTTMVVVGDRMSSNTKRLFELCKEHCDNTYAVESAEDIVDCDIEGDAIGLTAGASTPDWVIKEVIGKMTEELMNAEITAQVPEQEEAAAAVESEKIEATKVAVEENVENDEETMAGFERTMVRLRNGQMVTGTVLSVTDNAVYVNVGYKSDGIISKEDMRLEDGVELADAVKVGDEIEVEVVKVNDGDGNVLLSRKSVKEKAVWLKLAELKEQGEIFEVKCTRSVKGGVLCNLMGETVFVPASQLSFKFVKEPEKYVEKTLRIKLLDVDVKARRMLGSQRVVLVEEQTKKENEFWDTYSVGSLVSSTVKSITSFGVFVGMGIFDGMIHISDLSWQAIAHPSEIVKVGDPIDAIITKIDKENKKISLSRRMLLPRPWDTINERYKEGDIIKGKITRITAFGAFVRIEPTVEAMLHISQVTYHRINTIEEIYKVGDEIEAQILSIDAEKKRINISTKALIEPPVREARPARQPRKSEGEGGEENKRSRRSDRAKAADKEPKETFVKEDMNISLSSLLTPEMLEELTGGASEEN